MTSMQLDIVGPGIIFYSPAFAAEIREGEDYLESSYTTPEDVQRHIQNGTIVGFSTGSPGRFLLRFHDGYPANDALNTYTYKLRLGFNCKEGVCFRDLYSLLQWSQKCPAGQFLQLKDGFYHVTLCSEPPPSGVIGDDQTIEVYLQELSELPRLSNLGIPTLCH